MSRPPHTHSHTLSVDAKVDLVCLPGDVVGEVPESGETDNSSATREKKFRIGPG